MSPAKYLENPVNGKHAETSSIHSYDIFFMISIHDDQMEIQYLRIDVKSARDLEGIWIREYNKICTRIASGAHHRHEFMKLVFAHSHANVMRGLVVCLMTVCMISTSWADVVLASSVSHSANPSPNTTLPHTMRHGCLPSAAIMSGAVPAHNMYIILTHD